MSNKTKIVLDSANTMFPNDGTPFNLKGIKKVIISDLNNEDRIQVAIHYVGGEVAGNLPIGKNMSIEIPIEKLWSALFMIGIEIPENKKVTFEFEAI